MTVTSGTVAFLTKGENLSLSAFPAITEFAAAIDRKPSVIVRLPDRIEDGVAEQRVEDVRSRLPAVNGGVAVQGVRPKELRPALLDIANTSNGIAALLPTRRGGLSRVLQTNFYERLLHDGPLPILALPSDGRMRPIKRLLFPADYSPRSDAAFEWAADLAARLGAELHLLHVFGPDRLLESEIDIEKRSAAQSPGELYQIDKDTMATLGERASARGVRAVCETAEGRAHEQILVYTQKAAIDLIVMSSHGPRSYEDILYGTTTTRVIQKSPIPVLARHN